VQLGRALGLRRVVEVEGGEEEDGGRIGKGEGDEVG